MAHHDPGMCPVDCTELFGKRARMAEPYRPHHRPASTYEWYGDCHSLPSRERILRQLERGPTIYAGPGEQDAIRWHNRSSDRQPGRDVLQGLGATDIPGFDLYPQEFNATDPTRWNRVPMWLEGAHRSLPSDKPLYLSELQGGSFDASRRRIGGQPPDYRPASPGIARSLICICRRRQMFRSG
jgi:hypothetical protein